MALNRKLCSESPLEASFPDATSTASCSAESQALSWSAMSGFEEARQNILKVCPVLMRMKPNEALLNTRPALSATAHSKKSERKLLNPECRRFHQMGNHQGQQEALKSTYEPPHTRTMLRSFEVWGPSNTFRSNARWTASSKQRKHEIMERDMNRE